MNTTPEPPGSCHPRPRRTRATTTPAHDAPLTERELAWVEHSAGREPGSVLTRLVAETRALRAQLADEAARWQDRAEAVEAEPDDLRATLAVKDTQHASMAAATQAALSDLRTVACERDELRVKLAAVEALLPGVGRSRAWDNPQSIHDAIRAALGTETEHGS